MVVWHVTTEIMLVIIYLLEDEQELRLGMLIRPNVSIISACSMHVLCDFAMFCLNFHTLLNQFVLTYLLSAPSCQFLVSAIFVFQVFRPLKLPKKFRENYIKNQRQGTFRNNQRRQGGPPPEARRVPGAGPPWAAPGGLLASWWVPLTPPFAYIYPSG